jgi:hypothetical protein
MQPWSHNNPASKRVLLQGDRSPDQRLYGRENIGNARFACTALYATTDSNWPGLLSFSQTRWRGIPKPLLAPRLTHPASKGPGS